MSCPMHFFFTGPRVLGFRLGMIFSARDFQRRRPDPPPMEGAFLYVIEGAPGLVKVGITSDPRARLAALQTACPYPLEFAAILATPGHGYDIEGAAHAILGPHRGTGEWFRVPPRVAIEAIRLAAERLRQPLLSVSLDRADTILAIIRSGAGEPPTRSARPLQVIFWTLSGILASLVALAVVGWTH